MSVFTALNEKTVNDLLHRYALGALQRYQGIQAGVTNTLYQVHTTRGDYLLTLFEELTVAQLSPYLHLLDFLAARAIPCNQPIKDNKGEWIQTVKQKPTVIMTYLPGKTVERVSPEQCQYVGALLARLHNVAKDFPMMIPNLRDATWREASAEKLYPVLAQEDATLLQQEMHFQRTQDYCHLPRGIIHMDLFRDNVLFEQDQLTGIIDFFYACTNIFLLDVAICALDWCRSPNGELQPDHYRALISAYHKNRLLTAEEKHAWPAVTRLASLRFWLSRLLDFHFPAEGEKVHIKDPAEFHPTRNSLGRLEFFN